MTDWHGVVLPPDLGARLDRVLAALQATRSSATAQTVRVLLAGAPGVGKTEVRRALAESCGLPLIKVGPRDLGNGMLGGATVAVKALFERARQAAPSMILSDNFEQFAWHRDARDGGSATTERIMATMMELDGGSSSERGPVSIVTETYDLNLVDEAVLRRGFDVIEVPLPNEACRVEILRRALRKAPVSPDLDVDETAAALGLLLDARSGRDLERLVKETVTNAFEDADRRGVDFQNIRITREMLFDHKMVRQVLPPQAVNFDSLDLPEEVQRTFRPLANLIRHHPEMPQSRARLFVGPANVAADVARFLAVESGLPFQEISGESLLTRERQQPGCLRQMLDSARSTAPCALLVTEFERVAAKRGTPFSEKAHEGLVSDILVHTDDRRPEFVLLMGTTDDLETVDSAVQSHMLTLVLPDSPARGPAAGV